MKALVIVGHGSHLNSDSSLPVYEHAARIRETGEFEEVVECFWKEEPSMRHVLDTIESDEVYVVPAFISEGYFTQQIIPRELGLDGPLTEKGGKRVRYAGPLGTFEGMPDVILERTADLLRDKDTSPGKTALVLLGHGTDLNKNSSGVIYLNADRIRERNIYDLVEVGFLDQEPEIGGVVDSVEAKNVVVIPVFIAEGWHTRETIPEDLDLDGEVTVRGDRTIFYGAPVGTHRSMAKLIADRARETRLLPESGTESLAAEARESFAAWVAGSEDGRVFGQVLVEHTGSGYSIRHVEDADDEGLEASDDPREAREIARLTEEGQHRPLKSSPNLKRGWKLDLADEEALISAMNYLYPAGVVHW
ncbi:MAG: CbiX/SirB N-terminal domain-containing protein, partial [Rubrobacteraceae bacterium]